MKLKFISMCLLGSAILASPVSMGDGVTASPKLTGVCVKNSGVHNGIRYAGFKCALDSAPRDWVIHLSVTEQQDSAKYRELLRLPAQARCDFIRQGDGNRLRLDNCQ